MTRTNARHQVDDVTPDALEGVDSVLWVGNPDCDHEIVDASGGGIRCLKCAAWYCF